MQHKEPLFGGGKKVDCVVIYGTLDRDVSAHVGHSWTHDFLQEARHVFLIVETKDDFVDGEGREETIEGLPVYA